MVENGKGAVHTKHVQQLNGGSETDKGGRTASQTSFEYKIALEKGLPAIYKRQKTSKNSNVIQKTNRKSKVPSRRQQKWQISQGRRHQKRYNWERVPPKCPL